MKSSDSLSKYNSKRIFAETSEPEGVETVDDSSHRFVVQEHHASRLHWDFRLEMDGVLKSWAVPKGPTMDLGVKRLAVMVEDHPVSYIDFEGAIPEGNYGAGTVEVWDSGHYVSLHTEDPMDGLKKGILVLLLNGKRLKGVFDLVQTKRADNQWLLFRSPEHQVSNPKPETPSQPSNPTEIPGAKKARKPAEIKPMLAGSIDLPFDDPKWEFEIKWDGYRTLLHVNDGEVRLISRNGKDLTASFAELADLEKGLASSNAILDGEIVALDAKGLPRFQALQNRLRFGRRAGAGAPNTKIKSDPDVTYVYMAFDLPYCDGFDLTECSLAKRRELLSTLIHKDASALRFSEGVIGDGKELLKTALDAGLEGIMAKRLSSTYKSTRTEDWLKIKGKQTMDAVLCGFTKSEAADRPFGALALGAYSGDNLIYIGNVGSGFNHAEMTSLYKQLADLKSETSPFAGEVDSINKLIWIKPDLVCEVNYAEITDSGRLRQPVYVRQRMDKSPRECVLMSEQLESIKDKTPDPSEALAGLGDESGPKEIEAHIDGNIVRLTNLNKLFWPDTHTTKGDLLRYYADVAPLLIPHLKDRPLVVQRFPNGAAGQGFFQHNIKDQPDYLKTLPIEEHSGTVCYALCDELADLLYLVNLGAIPIHYWSSRQNSLDNPDWIVFDLDPPDEFKACIEVAHEIKTFLAEIKLKTYVKTSGSNGLHVYVPVKNEYSSEQIREIAHLLAQSVQARIPKLVTLERMVKKRGAGQVYLDYGQNGKGKTVVAPYSVRPGEKPYVSTPLTWDEVTDDLDPKQWDIESVPERLKKRGDLFEPVLKAPQTLTGPFEANKEGTNK